MAKYRRTLIIDTDSIQIIKMNNGKTMIVQDKEISNEDFQTYSSRESTARGLGFITLSEDIEHEFELINNCGEIVEFDEDGDRVPPMYGN